MNNKTMNSFLQEYNFNKTNEPYSTSTIAEHIDLSTRLMYGYVQTQR